MRGHKVVIPPTLQDKVCRELHSSHFGIVKMKAEARKRLWFPGVDAALERLAGACGVCCALRPAPPHAPLAPWPLPPHTFYRIHIDFLGPFHDNMLLIIVDAYSKWVECYDMSTTYNSKAVISKLNDFMSRFGVPHTLVSDNGTSFTSLEFRDFCKLNGIEHVLSPAYHPASNGQAESYVKIVKKGLKAIIMEGCNKKTIQGKIAKLLFDYRNSKNSTTDKTPAEIVFGRALRSRLDLLNPTAPSPSSTDLTQTVARNQSLQAKYYRGKHRTDFKENENVWITKNTNNKKYSWIQGIIRRKKGNIMYVIYVPQLGCEVTRHIDQIRSRLPSSSNEDQDWDPDVVPDLATLVANQPEPVTQPEEGGGSGTVPEQGTPATPPRAAVTHRRWAISPTFATPTAGTDVDDDDGGDDEDEQPGRP